VRVVTPFVGGGFGSGLRPQYQLFLAVMAALDLKRSVRVELTRDQMFTFGYRPTRSRRGAGRQRGRRAPVHQARRAAGTSRFEDYQEVVVNWSTLLYHADNTELTYKLAKLDTYTPADMRAPGAPTGAFAMESALDELAYELKIDPVELRLRNYTETDENSGKQLTSKELRACYAQGAARFGWAGRNPEPRSMREGRELIGWGMATGVWEAQMNKTSARATLTADGKLEVASATADMGTGTYTILTQIAADALGLRMEDVTTRIGDSSLPQAPVSGGRGPRPRPAPPCRRPATPYASSSSSTRADGRLAARQREPRPRHLRGRQDRPRRPTRRGHLRRGHAAAGVDKLEAEETRARARSPRCATRPTRTRPCSWRCGSTRSSACSASPGSWTRWPPARS
jgi:xanthine dehydrogenase YagR molybdenum-binding subunit